VGGVSFWNHLSAAVENTRAYFQIAFTAEEDLPKIGDLQKQLTAERQELEDNVNNLKDLTTCMLLLIKQKREELFAHLQQWKRQIIALQTDKSRACI
jgi:hypothetical protein